jgi:hypothetical protein
MLETPDGVDGIWIAVPGRASEHAGLDIKDEEVLFVIRGRNVESLPFRQELPGEIFASAVVIHRKGAARQMEGVLVVSTRERVQSEAAVPEEVAALGRWDDECKQTAVVDLWTDGVEAWTTVGPCRREEREADAELVEERTASCREVGS